MTLHAVAGPQEMLALPILSGFTLKLQLAVISHTVVYVLPYFIPIVPFVSYDSISFEGCW